MGKGQKIEKFKKVLIILGGVFNVLACAFLVGIILLLIFKAGKAILNFFLIGIMVFFDVGIICYIIAWVTKILTKEEIALQKEIANWNKLWDDYKNNEVSIDVWRVLEYYYKVVNVGHLEFFSGLDMIKLQETVKTLIKILPIEFAHNLQQAYKKYVEDDSLFINNSSRIEDVAGDFVGFDAFFKENKQKYENYIKSYAGLIDRDEI